MALQIKLSNYANGKTPAIVPSGQELISVKAVVTPTTAEVIAGVCFKGLVLPAGCLPVEYKAICTDMDSAANITWDFGVVNSSNAISIDAADGGGKWISAGTTPQAGGMVLSTATAASQALIDAVTASAANRTIGVVTTANATGLTGTITLEMTYCSA